MRDVFRGWKRKLGCVTLLLAVAFMLAWCRSLIIADKLFISGNEVKSFEGRLSWTRQVPGDRVHHFRWTSEVLTEWREVDFWLPEKGNILWTWCGFAAGTGSAGYRRFTPYESSSDRIQIHYWVVSYRTLVATLTLLAATLILWPHRPRNPPPAVNEPEVQSERTRSATCIEADD